MTAKKLIVSKYLQYVLIAVGVLILIGFVRQIGGVLLTFLLAAVLAYILNPVVRRLENSGVPRVAAVLGVFSVLLVAVSVALLVLIIPAVGQVQALINDPQELVDQIASLESRMRNLPYVGTYIGDYISQIDRDALTRLVTQNAPSAGQAVNVALGFIGGVFGVFGTILNLLLMLIVSIYLLLDRERITRAALNTIPETVRDQALELFHVVEAALIKYIKAQLSLCVIMGVIGWAIAFFVIGKYALLVGLWVGATEIIPVLGAFLGAVPAVLIALLTGGFWQALIVVGLFLVAQQLEGNILVPRIMGGSVGVHPLWVLFATLAATALYGVVGAVFAVPIVAIIASTLRYLRVTLTFERWDKALVSPSNESNELANEETAPEEVSPEEVSPEDAGEDGRFDDSEDTSPKADKVPVTGGGSPGDSSGSRMSEKLQDTGD